MLKSCELTNYLITIEQKVVDIRGDYLSIDPEKHFGLIDEKNTYYHIKQGIPEIILEPSGYICNDRVICIDNHLQKERDIGPLVNYSTFKSFVYFAQQYLDLKERVKSLLDNPKRINLDSLELHIDALNNYKGLGDYQYLYESLANNLEKITQTLHSP